MYSSISVVRLSSMGTPSNSLSTASAPNSATMSSYREGSGSTGLSYLGKS